MLSRFLYLQLVLKQVQREVVLVVEHTPNEGVKVHLSRRRNITEAISDAITLSAINTPITRLEHREHTTGINRQRGKGMSPARGLKVTFADGTIICERKAVDTLKKMYSKIWGRECCQNMCQSGRLYSTTKSCESCNKTKG